MNCDRMARIISSPFLDDDVTGTASRNKFTACVTLLNVSPGIPPIRGDSDSIIVEAARAVEVGVFGAQVNELSGFVCRLGGCRFPLIGIDT